MPTPGPIGEREREILTAVVETFIATGEPVGSRTLARSNREGLSPATIRAWIRQRRIGYVRSGRAVRIPSGEIRRLVERGTVPAILESRS